MKDEKDLIVSTDEETDKAMKAFLIGGGEVDPEELPPAKSVYTKKGAIFCSLTIFSLLLWNISGYGAIFIAAIALVAGLALGVSKNAMRIMISNSITVAFVTIIRVLISVIFTIWKTVYFYILSKNYPSSLANLEALMNNLLAISVFVLFVISAYMFFVKKTSIFFKKTSSMIADSED